MLLFIFLVLAVQLVFLALCYNNLSSFALKYGALSNNGAVGDGYRSAREIPGGMPLKKMATNLKWLQNISTTAVVATTQSELAKEEEAEVATKHKLIRTDNHVKEPSVLTTISNNAPIILKEAAGNILEGRKRRLHPPTLLPHSDSVDDIRNAAEQERRRTLERLRAKRMEVRKRAEEEYRRKAAEKRAQREAKIQESKETPEEKRNKALKKTIPQMEHDRAEKMHQLWEEEKRKPGQESLDYEKFAAQYPGDTMNSSLSEYFQEVCNSRVEPLVECLNRSKRQLNVSEAEGSDILFSMRTTLRYHEERLPLLFETWLTDVDPANVYIVTDGDDEDLTWKLRTLSK